MPIIGVVIGIIDPGIASMGPGMSTMEPGMPIIGVGIPIIGPCNPRINSIPIKGERLGPMTMLPGPEDLTTFITPFPPPGISMTVAPIPGTIPPPPIIGEGADTSGVRPGAIIPPPPITGARAGIMALPPPPITGAMAAIGETAPISGAAIPAIGEAPNIGAVGPAIAGNPPIRGVAPTAMGATGEIIPPPPPPIIPPDISLLNRAVEDWEFPVDSLISI
jgi:hypothetical protein